MINVIQDLNGFLGTNYSPKEVEDLNTHYFSLLDEEIAKAYQKANDDKSLAMKYFYESEVAGLYYLYSLAVWSGLRNDRPTFTNYMIKFAKRYGVKKIFDFGIGIGADAIVLAKEGFEVSGCDVDNIHTDFLKWRIKKHGVDIKVFSEFPNERVDMINLLAVIEHVWEPVKLVTHLAHYTKYFTWIIDLHDDGKTKGRHCMEFYDQLLPFTYMGFIKCDGVEYTRRYPIPLIDHGRPQFYEVRVT